MLKGSKHKRTSRKRMSEAQKHRGARPPWVGRAWSAEEDELCRALSPQEVSMRTGRSLGAVFFRRTQLGLPHWRRVHVQPIKPKKPPGTARVWTKEEDEIVRTKSVAEAVKLIGVSDPTIRKRRLRLGVAWATLELQTSRTASRIDATAQRSTH
jgi:hypothetical protein